jgi:hypothetical protein
VKYLPPFDLVVNSLALFELKGERYAALPYAELIRLIKLFLASAEIDEEWYLRRYKDVGPAIAAGEMASARLHFINNGYFEGRLAFPLEVNEESYLTRYPDVADAIANGTAKSAHQHYVENGYREGRTPDDL